MAKKSAKAPGKKPAQPKAKVLPKKPAKKVTPKAKAPSKSSPPPLVAGKPATFPRLIPYFAVADPAKAVEFYKSAFGFTVNDVMPKDGPPYYHVEMRFYEDAMVMFGQQDQAKAKAPATSGARSPLSLYLYCENVDRLFARAKAAGARVEQEPENKFYGDRMCVLVDPDGYQWAFATYTGKQFAPPS